MTAGFQRDTLEFASGLVIGAALGMAVGSLLAPDRSPPERIRRRLRRPKRRLRKRAGRAREAAEMAVDRSVRLAGELRSFGEELVLAAREEFVAEALRRLGNGRTGAGRDGIIRLRSLRERLPSRGER